MKITTIEEIKVFQNSGDGAAKHPGSFPVRMMSCDGTGSGDVMIVVYDDVMPMPSHR